MLETKGTRIYQKGASEVLGIVDNINNFDKGLGFYGNKEDFIQIGKFRYDTGKILRNHMHIRRDRLVEKTQEILIVFKGKCKLEIFGVNGTKVDSLVLNAGDFYIAYNGGFGGEVLTDDTIMMEIKPGPYTVASDDEDRVLL
jgi:hypothetical protein